MKWSAEPNQDTLWSSQKKFKTPSRKLSRWPWNCTSEFLQVTGFHCISLYFFLSKEWKTWLWFQTHFQRSSTDSVKIPLHFQSARLISNHPRHVYDTPQFNRGKREMSSLMTGCAAHLHHRLTMFWSFVSVECCPSLKANLWANVFCFRVAVPSIQKPL